MPFVTVVPLPSSIAVNVGWRVICSEMPGCASDSNLKANRVFQTGVCISHFCWIVIFSVVAPALLLLSMHVWTAVQTARMLTACTMFFLANWLSGSVLRILHGRKAPMGQHC